MRHRKSGLKLNRNSSNRKALFRNLAIALIDHKLIKTTLPKAKELRRFVEPLVTISKVDSVANRRLAFSRLNNKQAVGQLFTEVAAKSKNRPGGYTRIIKAGYRAGDNAPMAYVEFVDRSLEEPLVFETKAKKPTASSSKAPSKPAAAVEETTEKSAIPEQSSASSVDDKTSTDDASSTENLEKNSEVKGSGTSDNVNAVEDSSTEKEDK